MKEDLSLLSVTEAVKKIASGEISGVDLVKASNARVAAADPVCHAWTVHDPEHALNQARVLDESRARGEPVRALEGIPVGVKDIFNTRDFVTGMGSPIFDGHTPGNDARVVYMVRQTHAIIPGKTVTAEFAVHTPGKTLNPHNPLYSPGTSSSGSAAAVACAMVPIALGTQTAGSIVRPASYCGVYGFKPSFGLVPRTGMLKTTDSLDQVGGFVRAPEDLGLLFESIRIRGRDFPIATSRLEDPAWQEVGGRPWRVGLVTDSVWVWDKATDYARQQIRILAASIGASDLEVSSLALPESFNRAHGIHETIYNKTLAYYFREEFEQDQLISPVLNDMIRAGQRISLEQYQDALDQQARLAHELDELLGRYDVILTLSTAGSAPKWKDPDIPDSCLIWSLCGVPVLSLPLFRDPVGMPFGAQVLARRYSDYKLLKFVELLRVRGIVTTAPLAQPGA
jgi:Asp-tRNA(Asn)/Glu-tRNA(Gln) amidotransferase A subunit family amidase